MSPGPWALRAMQWACLRQVGARPGRWGNAALEIQQVSLTQYPTISYSPMRRPSNYTERNIRWLTKALQYYLCMNDLMTDSNAGRSKGEDWDNFSLSLVCSLLPFRLRQWCSKACYRLHAWMVSSVIHAFSGCHGLDGNDLTGQECLQVYGPPNQRRLPTEHEKTCQRSLTAVHQTTI